MKTCIICGKEIGPNQGYYSTEDGPVCSSKCHTEHYWEKIIDDEDRVVIDGNCYSIGREDVSKESKGYNGRYFRIKLFTGESIETTNLRFNDEVPEEYRHILIDNARFIL